MDTLPDLVARDRRSDRMALSTPNRAMDYRRFCTTTWKTSNFLRHLGVGNDRGVAILADSSSRQANALADSSSRQADAIPPYAPPPLLTFFGAALLDTPTRFVDERTALPAAIETVDARAVLVPVEHEEAVDAPAGTTLVTYDGEPTEPTTENWAEGVWSENPAFVPSMATSESTALSTPDGRVSHGQLLAAGERVASELDLAAEDTVHFRGSLADPRVVAGIVAAFSVGGAVRLGTTAEAGDLTVGDDGDLPLGSVTVESTVSY